MTNNIGSQKNHTVIRFDLSKAASHNASTGKNIIKFAFKSLWVHDASNKNVKLSVLPDAKTNNGDLLPLRYNMIYNASNGVSYGASFAWDAQPGEWVEIVFDHHDILTPGMVNLDVSGTVEIDHAYIPNWDVIIPAGAEKITLFHEQIFQGISQNMVEVRPLLCRNRFELNDFQSSPFPKNEFLVPNGKRLTTVGYKLTVYQPKSSGTSQLNLGLGTHIQNGYPITPSNISTYLEADSIVRQIAPATSFPELTQPAGSVLFCPGLLCLKQSNQTGQFANYVCEQNKKPMLFLECLDVAAESGLYLGVEIFGYLESV